MKNLIQRSISKIFLIFIGAIVCYGVTYYVDVKNREASDQLERNKSSVELVAIVNLDEGVESNSKIVNYGTLLLQSVNVKYVNTGLSDARSGVESGKYSAYFIIPATFSSKVEQINDNPEQVSFEFAISNNLKEKAKEAAIYDVHEIYFTLNSNLSKVYVASVLEEFHYAQDVAGAIMNNDISDTETLNSVGVEDLVETIKLPELKEINPELPDLNLTKEFDESFAIAKSINDVYDQSMVDLLNAFKTIQTQTNTTFDKKTLVTQAVLKLKAEIEKNEVLPYDDTIRFSDENQVIASSKTAILDDVNKYEDLKNQYISLCQQISSISGCVITTTVDAGTGVETDTYDFSLVSGNGITITDNKAVDPNGFTQTIATEVGKIETQFNKSRTDRNTLITTNITTATTIRTSLIALAQELLTANQSADSEDEKLKKMVTDFDPNTYIRKNEIDVLKQNLIEKNQAIEVKTDEQLNLFNTNITQISQIVTENERLQAETIMNGQEAIVTKLENGLATAKQSRANNNITNKNYLENLTGLLPYTRIGSVENTDVYGFIATPTIMTDKTKTTDTNSNVSKINNTSNIDKNLYFYGIIVLLILGVGLLIYKTLTAIRKENVISEELF